MASQMIVTDLDRTLLRSDKTISGYTAQVLWRCHEKGIKIVFATARPKRTVRQFCLDVPVDALILHNGAVVYAEGQLLASYGIDSDVKNRILLSIGHDHPEVTLSVEIDNIFYANFDVPTAGDPTQFIKADFSHLPDRPADKIIVGVSGMDDISLYGQYLPDDLYIEMNDGKLGFILNRKATKWNAIKTVAGHFGIANSEVVAFGDDYNDIGMLQNCGMGVAVANALNDAKAAADFICDQNDKDGVARWLEENVLQDCRK